MADRSLTGKVALVVGGTRGIGLATAGALAAAGARVALTGRSQATAQEAASRLSAEHDVECMALGWDIADVAGATLAVAQIVERFGRLDVCVVSAGINPYWRRALTVTPDMWDEVLGVNLRGVFFAVQAVAEPMVNAGRGSIVVLSSVTATRGVSRGLPYVASKGGLDAMVKSLAVEWAELGVRVNAIAAGFIETDLTAGVRDHDGIREDLVRRIPMGRFGQSSEVADLAVVLAADGSSYVTGHILHVDGGYAA